MIASRTWGIRCDHPAVAVVCVFLDDRQSQRLAQSRFRRGSCVARRPLLVNRSAHAIRASRSASSSQPFTARMTSSRGGMPFGKSAFKSASRSVALPVRWRPVAFLRVPPLLERLDVRERRALLPVAGVPAVVVRRDRRPAARALLDVPTTPCACRRWAPSAAARENVRPHSGHLNSCLLVDSFRARAI